MSTELVAILLLFAWSVMSGIFGLVSIRRVKRDVREEAGEIGNAMLDGIGEILTEPTVKKAFTILGKQGGDAKAENMLVDQMATDALDSPQFAAIKMGASTLGFDLDDYIEKHGAVKTLTAASQLGKMLGIDIMNLDLGAILGGQGSQGSGDNPLFRR